MAAIASEPPSTPLLLRMRPPAKLDDKQLLLCASKTGICVSSAPPRVI